MKAELPLGTQSDEVLKRADRLNDNLLKPRTRLGDVVTDILYLTGANHLTHPSIPDLIIRGVRHIQQHHEDKFEPLLIQIADKAPPDSKLARLLTAEWTGLYEYASLEDRAVMFPKMYAAFKDAKSVTFREAAGRQVLSSCFQHATTDDRLTEVKLALTDIRHFASQNERKGLLHETAAKINDLRHQEQALQNSLG